MWSLNEKCKCLQTGPEGDKDNMTTTQKDTIRDLKYEPAVNFRMRKHDRDNMYVNKKNRFKGIGPCVQIQ